MTRLAIEMGGDGPAYGKIHREGCRDLRDPEPIGDASDKATAEELADSVTYWAANDGIDPDEYGYKFAPCARFTA